MVAQRDYPSITEFQLETAPSKSSGVKFFAASFVCAVLTLLAVCYQEQIDVVRLIMFCSGFFLLAVVYFIIYALLTQTLSLLLRGVLICIGLIVLVSLIPTLHTPQVVSRRAQCQIYLKQIGLALQNYCDLHSVFPERAKINATAKQFISWRVLCLPFLEHQNVFDEYHQHEPWNSQHNAKLIQHMPMVYRCPSEPNNETDKYHASYLAISGDDTMWPDDENLSWNDVPDGTSNTVLVTESHRTGITWSEPRDRTANQLIKERRQLKRRAETPATNHAGGSNAVLVDGSVRYIPANIDPQVLEQILNRHDGQPQSPDW